MKKKEMYDNWAVAERMTKTHEHIINKISNRIATDQLEATNQFTNYE